MSISDSEQLPSAASNEELALAARLGHDGLRRIDDSVVAHTGARWLKAARVIACALQEGSFDSSDAAFDLHARRLIDLVASGELEGQGDLTKPRWSEVRRRSN